MPIRSIAGFCWVFSFPGLVLAFNLDTKAPIVKEGRPASFFGYSAAHHLVKNRATGVAESVFLVGAPRDNITDNSFSTKVREIVRPGAVYQCPYSSHSNDCQIIRLDIEDPRADEDKSDQWMGVSVVSQGTEDGVAVACAHRYKTRGTSYRWGIGLCISLSNSLDQEDSYEPCFGLKKDLGHGEYGFCQAGISSAISQDGDLLLGAPGPYNWRGALFKNTVVKTLGVDSEWYQNVVEDPTPATPGPIPASQYYSYLGMSVKIGNLLKDGSRTYVGGAPRANDTGHVLLFKVEGKALTIVPEHILVGEQFGSYFGHDIAIGDFNLDGLDDIAVGAPFYRDPGVGGAVYIYMNSQEGITSRTKPQKIVSRKMKDQECGELDCHNARFGSALAAIGDLDRDGFDDLAVGAPYEGNGAVYILRGSAKGVLEFAQRIAASQFPASMPSAFGISIVGNFDVDQNGYPDLAVGAYTSDQLFVLRARPVINVETVIRHTPEKVNPKETQCAKDGRHNICFEIQLCFKFTAEPKDRFDDKVDLEYILEAEKFTGAVISRVFFKGTGGMDEGHTIQKTVRLHEQSKGILKCKEHVVYVTKSTKDYLSPIPFQLTYRLQNAEDPSLYPGGTLPDMNSYPVLNEAANKQQLMIKFEMNCGGDDQCDSKLSLQSSLNLTRDSDQYYVLRIGQDKHLFLNLDIQNTGEDAHEAAVTVVVPDFLTYQGLDDEEQKYSCDPTGNVISCFVGNPLAEKQSAKFGIRLDPSKAVQSTEKYEISVNVTTTSVEENTDDNFVVLHFRVMIETDIHVFGFSDPTSVYFGGEVRGASSIKFEDQIGSEVKHSYEIKNRGDAPVVSSTLVVHWPYELQSDYPDGKYVLYILEAPMLQGEGVCHVDRTMINHLGIQSRLPGSNSTQNSVDVRKRYRRDSDVTPKVTRATDYKRNIKYATVDCQDKTAKCYRFNCTLGELLPGKSTVLSIRSRLWNSTFLEDFSHLDEVRISSYAEIVIDPRLNIHQPNTINDIRKVTTTAKPELQEPKPVPIWVIIVSVVAGVILLAVIILLLCKCGFFRRQQREQMMEHKAKVERKSYDEYHD